MQKITCLVQYLLTFINTNIFDSHFLDNYKYKLILVDKKGKNKYSDWYF